MVNSLPQYNVRNRLAAYVLAIVRLAFALKLRGLYARLNGEDAMYDSARRIVDSIFGRHGPLTEPASRNLSLEFRRYAEQWRKETRILSSVQAKIFNHNYQRIIGMGPAVLPLIFAELRERGGQWYGALECITGENPATSATSIEEAKRLWLDYAVKHHYIG